MATLTGCEGAIELHVERRFPADPPTGVEALRVLARAHSQDQCDDGALSPAPDPEAVYGPGSIELVDRELLDPELAPPTDDHTATSAIWERFRTDPRLDDATWERMGAGQATCPDGYLYLTLVLQADPAPPYPGWATGVRRVTEGDGDVTLAGVTTDGTTVAIQAEATDLGPAPSGPDTWLYDVASRDLSPTGLGTVVPVLSADGSTIVYLHETVEGGSTVFPIESYDLATLDTTRLATNFSPGYPRSISANGDVVAAQVFGAGGSYLQVIRGGTPAELGSLGGATYAISVSDDGDTLGRNGFSADVLDLAGGPATTVEGNCFNSSTRFTSSASGLSADGRFLAFGCLDRPSIPGDTDGANDLFVWDRTTGTSVLATPGGDGLGVLTDPSISDDGRFVAFSYGTSATSGSTYLLDRTTGLSTVIATVPSDVAVSGDGSLVAFTAVAPDRPGGAVEDLFVWTNPAA